MLSFADEVVAGDPLVARVTWHDFSGDAEVPSAVQYRVFDAVSGTPIGAAVDVTPVASEMEWSIPGTMLPGATGSAATRKLLIEVRATFATAADVLTVQRRITTRRTYS